MEDTKRKRGRPPISIPKEYRELLQNLEETTDQLMDATQFIDEHNLTEDWEEYKTKKYTKRLLENRRVK